MSPHSQPFDPETALHHARSIQAIYNGLAPNIHCAETDTQARIEKISLGHHAIYFPGTASWRDCLTDAKIRKANSAPGRIHRGFAAAAGSVYSDILAALSPLRPAGTALRITLAGHSLGGAIASIIAFWLQLNGKYQINSIYTFGSPRIGNGPWARDYNRRLGERTFRVVNAGDPVPHVPWVLATYRHIETLVYLKRDGGIESNFILSAAQEFLEAFSYPSQAARLMRLRSHSLDNYLTQLERLNQRN